MRKSSRVIRPGLERLDGRCLPSGYTVAQMTAAYGLNAIAFTSSSGQSVVGDGAGETIALVEAYHDPNLTSDLHVFDQANGLPDPSMAVDDLAGDHTNNTWASEEVLDVEWAHAIAPGASILVIEARSATMANLMRAVDIARDAPGVVAVSMSWGFSETTNETSLDAHFRTPAGHEGITFVAASGDDGAAGGPSYPATSPDVVAVGGTTLAIGPGGRYLAEVAWPGSGGGYSRYEAEPAYQKSVQSSGHKSTPDVAFDGDPNTGVEEYETPPKSSAGSWIVVGGTSLGTPAWAAILAIVDQGRALEGQGSLDGATQTLPALYSLPSSDFHTLGGSLPALGGNGLLGNTLYGGGSLARTDARRAARAATETANTRTGLGSPVGPSLVDALVASDLSEPLTMLRVARATADVASAHAGRAAIHRHERSR